MLAAAMLLFQLSAVSQGSTSITNSLAKVESASLTPAAEPEPPAEPPAAEPPAAQPIKASAEVQTAALNSAMHPLLLLAMRRQPAFAVPLEPGRLMPTPILTPGASPAPEPAAEPVPAPAAFIATQPNDERARLDELRRRHLWLTLAIAQHGAATFDALSTRHSVSNYHATELDPLLRPFVGNPSIYAAIQVGPAALEYLSWRMMHGHHDWERRTWWLPEVLGTALSFASGVHNLGVQ